MICEKVNNKIFFKKIDFSQTKFFWIAFILSQFEIKIAIPLLSLVYLSTG